MPLAQLDRASDYGSEGREFESSAARQNNSEADASLLFYCEYNKVPGYPAAIFDCVIGSGSYSNRQMIQKQGRLIQPTLFVIS